MYKIHRGWGFGPSSLHLLWDDCHPEWVTWETGDGLLPWEALQGTQWEVECPLASVLIDKDS